MAMKNYTAAQWDAVAWAQGSYGLPDTVIAKILNCPSATVRNARVKGGWDVRDLTKAHSGLTGWRAAEGHTNHLWGKRQARPEAQPQAGQATPEPQDSVEDKVAGPMQETPGNFPPSDDGDAETEDADKAPVDPAATLDRLTAALSCELQKAADGEADVAGLKRIDALVAAARTFDKLLSMKEKASPEGGPDAAETLTIAEKTRLLNEMDKRIDELAERRAFERQTKGFAPQVR